MVTIEYDLKLWGAEVGPPVVPAEVPIDVNLDLDAGIDDDFILNAEAVEVASEEDSSDDDENDDEDAPVRPLFGISLQCLRSHSSRACLCAHCITRECGTCAQCAAQSLDIVVVMACSAALGLVVRELCCLPAPPMPTTPCGSTCQ